jgi:peptidoglycan/LPS O-acetylase OafA/YrhL
MNYIQGIDGLRAVAVLSVIMFHSYFFFPSGGFVGVDIFFVISGFLISKIIYKEIQAGEFSLSNFYKRRMKRILPALYFMLFASALIAYIIMLPEDIHFLNKSLKKIVLFISNLFFMNETEYLGPKIFEMTYLNSWSLSVEEQFYFVWPLLFVLLLKLSRKFLLFFMIVVIIFSFVLPELLIFTHNTGPGLVYYYSAIARSGELLTGAFIAIFVSDKIEFYKKFLPMNLIASIGLIFIFYSVFFLALYNGYPGFNALYPTIGTALILLGVLSGARVTKFLEAEVLCYIGKISYSLYLWHWPILSLLYYINQSHEIPTSWTIFAILLMFTIAIFSYHFIENPIRKSNWSFNKSLIGLYVTPSLLIFSLVATSNYYTNQIYQDRELTSYGGDELCHGRISDDCIRGDTTKQPRILVTGDSHAAHLNYFFDKIGKDRNFSSLVLSASSCTPLFGFNEKVLEEYAWQPCQNLKSYIADNIKNYDLIILAGMWSFHLGMEDDTKSDPEFLVRLEETLNYLQTTSKKVFVVSQVPYLDYHPIRSAKLSKLGFPAKTGVLEKYKKANSIILEVVKKYPNVIWLDLAKNLEDTEEAQYYFDPHHLNIKGAKFLAGKWLEENTEL